MVTAPVLTLAWSMPSRWTFEMPPVRAFLDRWLTGCDVIVDPFCGESTRGTLRNDIAFFGREADEWCNELLPEWEGRADAVLFDPPYSPRQVMECYKAMGRQVTREDTQDAVLKKRVREPLARLLKPGGIALSFGWQSSGFGKDWSTEEVLLVRHGGSHNDTICVAQRKPSEGSIIALTKEWCEEAARIEGNSEVGAGMLPKPCTCVPEATCPKHGIGAYFDALDGTGL